METITILTYMMIHIKLKVIKYHKDIGVIMQLKVTDHHIVMVQLKIKIFPLTEKKIHLLPEL